MLYKQEYQDEELKTSHKKTNYQIDIKRKAHSNNGQIKAIYISRVIKSEPIIMSGLFQLVNSSLLPRKK